MASRMRQMNKRQFSSPIPHGMGNIPTIHPFALAFLLLLLSLFSAWVSVSGPKTGIWKENSPVHFLSDSTSHPCMDVMKEYQEHFDTWEGEIRGMVEFCDFLPSGTEEAGVIQDWLLEPTQGRPSIPRSFLPFSFVVSSSDPSREAFWRREEL